jgi:hypothetical protein
MGYIGVRCSQHTASLWFYLSFPFANGFLDLDFRAEDEIRALRCLRGTMEPWDQLTPAGALITSRVLQIKGVISLSARDTYFDLCIADTSLWPTILPEVVRIIKEVSHDPNTIVVPVSHDNSPQWHLPLLEALSA